MGLKVYPSQGRKLQMFWNWHYYGNIHPYSTKRFASAKIALNRARYKFGQSLKEIYIVKFTPTDNGETKEEKVFQWMKHKLIINIW